MAVGRVRVGCDAVRWQGVTTLRALAREAEQRSQRAAARLTRVRSAFTWEVKVNEGREVNLHAFFDMFSSGQLPFLGCKGQGLKRLWPFCFDRQFFSGSLRLRFSAP